MIRKLPFLGARPASLAAFLMQVGWMSVPAQEGSTPSLSRVQTVALQKGWNAVFLEVQPRVDKPAELFAGTPIDVVASNHTPVLPVQFVSDPSVDMFLEVGWGTWYAADRPDAFLKTLHVIYGGQAYLVHSREAYTWKVEGAVVRLETKWRPDTFNFVGFSVASPGAPTFEQFFSGSTALDQGRIYRLEGDSWRRVAVPSAEQMRSGEAFWIFCEGASDYQGPLRVETTIESGLILSDGISLLDLRSDVDHPISATLEYIPTGGDPAPLSIVIQAVGDSKEGVRSVPVPKPASSWEQPLPPLEPGEALRVPLALDQTRMTGPVGGALLKISTDLGSEIWFPVVGIRADLEQD